jgi:molybdenum cofactor cytidylyltransferase
MASSLKAGLAHVSETADGVIVALGDMPAVTAQDINRMIAAFDPDERRAIIVPVYKGKRGNPVLFARSYFAEMLAATGDTGAKAVIHANPDAVFEVEMESAAVLADADTPAAFEALKADFDAHE